MEKTEDRLVYISYMRVWENSDDVGSEDYSVTNLNISFSEEAREEYKKSASEKYAGDERFKYSSFVDATMSEDTFNVRYNFFKGLVSALEQEEERERA